MLKTGRKNCSCDTDSICEQLIPADSFYRKFREIIRPLISGGQFQAMYRVDNGIRWKFPH